MIMDIRHLYARGALLLALSATPLLTCAAVHVYSGIPLISTEEVPPVFSESYGAVSATYDDDTNVLQYQFQWRFPSGTEATQAHFHGPAARGETASPVITLSMEEDEEEQGVGRGSGSEILTEAQESELLSGLWYINVHSDLNPNGEIRAQMVELSPLDTLAVFEGTSGQLRIPVVVVPGFGIFDAQFATLQPLPGLTLGLQAVAVKDFDSAPAPQEPAP